MNIGKVCIKFFDGNMWFLQKSPHCNMLPIDKEIHKYNKDHSSSTFRNMDQITSFFVFVFVFFFTVYFKFCLVTIRYKYYI